MHADEARAVGDELKCLSHLGVGGVGVVEDQVLLGGCDHLALLDAAVGNHVVKAEEVLDVVHAERGLHRDVLVAQVVSDVERVDEVQEAVCVVVLPVDLVLAPCGCERALDAGAGRRGSSRARLEEAEELVSDDRLDVEHHLAVRVLDGLLVALVVDRLVGGLLAVLLQHELEDVRHLGLVLGKWDLLALCHGAVLEGARHLVGLHRLAWHLLDLSGDAQKLGELFHVLVERVDEVDGGHLREVLRLHHLFIDCHFNLLFELVLVRQNRRAALLGVLDGHDLVARHLLAVAARRARAGHGAGVRLLEQVAAVLRQLRHVEAAHMPVGRDLHAPHVDVSHRASRVDASCLDQLVLDDQALLSLGCGGCRLLLRLLGLLLGRLDGALHVVLGERLSQVLGERRHLPLGLLELLLEVRDLLLEPLRLLLGARCPAWLGSLGVCRVDAAGFCHSCSLPSGLFRASLRA